MSDQSSLFRDDFFSKYFSYASGNEAPIIAHRWAAISSLGAFISKDVWIKFGYTSLYPNIYTMLIGTPGSKKSTAIKMFKKLMLKVGYKGIAASKTTKEKYLLDLSGIEPEPGGANSDNLLEQNLWGNLNGHDRADSFIMADEFNDFFGNNNLEFISLLGSLWDWEGPYENRIKNGKSFTIPNPTISILGGNTPTGFATAFPPEILGQGFFSRIFLIYCEPKGVKITWPRIPSELEEKEIIAEILRVKASCAGEIKITEGAKSILDKIYKSYRGLEDVRFDSYSTRRFPHLLKLCIIHTLARYSDTIEESDVIYTNTVLSYAEHFMPKALGEFGKAKNSDISHKVMTLLEGTNRPLAWKDIWKHVSQDLENQKALQDMLMNLQLAGKIQTVGGAFLGVKRMIGNEASDVIDYTLLTDEERRMI